MGFPTKNDHFCGVLGVPPFKETPIYPKQPIFSLLKYFQLSAESLRRGAELIDHLQTPDVNAVPTKQNREHFLVVRFSC